MLLQRLAMSTFQPINKAKHISKLIAVKMSSDSQIPATDHESLSALETSTSNMTRAPLSQANQRRKKKAKPPSVAVPATKPPVLTSSEAIQDTQAPPRKKRKTTKDAPKGLRQ